MSVNGDIRQLEWCSVVSGSLQFTVQVQVSRFYVCFGSKLTGTLETGEGYGSLSPVDRPIDNKRYLRPVPNSSSFPLSR